MFKNKTIHFIGIGGISMSGIANMLKNDNLKITGSDQKQSLITDDLIKNGIKVTIGSNLADVKNSDVIIYTAAIKDDNPELIMAKKLNKEIFERSVALGILSKSYNNRFCIAGTHGKSTTTGMLANVFLKADLNPTIQIGAFMKEINNNYYVGSKDYLVMESCEYKNSFLNFFPMDSIITNIDADHLDYFKTFDNIKNSFLSFSKLIPKTNFLIINSDDENSLYLKDELNNVISIGINNISNYQAQNISYSSEGYPTFDVFKNNNFLINIKLSVRGLHNIYNSLSVFALAHLHIKDIGVIKKGIESYKGVGRRFEYIGNYKGALIYDDYAHHPKELITTLDSIKKMKFNKSYAIFQAHTFSRTKEHFNEFVQTLAQFENIIIAPIFAAREENVYNIKEEDLVNEIKKINNSVIYLNSFEKIVDYLKENLKEEDLAITIGAGNINEVGKKLID